MPRGRGRGTPAAVPAVTAEDGADIFKELAGLLDIGEDEAVALFSDHRDILVAAMDEDDWTAKKKARAVLTLRQMQAAEPAGGETSLDHHLSL